MLTNNWREYLENATLSKFWKHFNFMGEIFNKNCIKLIRIRINLIRIHITASSSLVQSEILYVEFTSGICYFSKANNFHVLHIFIDFSENLICFSGSIQARVSFSQNVKFPECTGSSENFKIVLKMSSSY